MCLEPSQGTTILDGVADSGEWGCLDDRRIEIKSASGMTSALDHNRFDG